MRKLTRKQLLEELGKGYVSLGTTKPTEKSREHFSTEKSFKDIFTSFINRLENDKENTEKIEDFVATERKTTIASIHSNYFYNSDYVVVELNRVSHYAKEFNGITYIMSFHKDENGQLWVATTKAVVK